MDILEQRALVNYQHLNLMVVECLDFSVGIFIFYFLGVFLEAMCFSFYY